MSARDEILWPLLMSAYRDARLGKRKTVDEQRFEQQDIINLTDLMWDINNRNYKPSRGIAFVIRKPVIREIFAAPFRDRVVHHLLFNYVAYWWDKRFIYDNYSCRRGKGNLFGIRRLYHHMMSASDNNQKTTYVLKLDLQGYFMSLPKNKLYEAAVWGLDRQFDKSSFEYKACKYLFKEIIYDDPTDGVRIRDKRNWNDLPKSKSLFYAPAGRGIVIGNLTSQLLSNIYLDKLDRYVTYDLGLKRYGRYVDDFYVVHNDKTRLLRAAKEIDDFLASIGLKLHPKKKFLQEINKGVPFLGAVVYPFRIQPGKRLKAGFFRSAHKLYRESHAGRNSDFLAESFQSYNGLIEHMKNKKWRRKVEQYRNSRG